MDEVWDDLAVRREDRRLRALIADDDDAVRKLLRAVLELDGWEVRDARDGDEAIALADSYRPDALVLDVMMPNTDGLTALHRIRENEANRDVPAVMFSSADFSDAAAAAGAEDFVGKLDIDELPDRVAKVVRRNDEAEPEPSV